MFGPDPVPTKPWPGLAARLLLRLRQVATSEPPLGVFIPGIGGIASVHMVVNIEH